jgi:lysozyme family protein
MNNGADIAALRIANGLRWNKAQLTRGPEFVPVAKRLAAAKDRYLAVEARTGVPWWVIAVIHEREASQAWDRSIAQGDPWNRISTHVPKGRGPFATWEAAAVDALVECAPHAARWTDWSAGGAMTLLEQYNGLGYFHRGLPSPYIWAGTDQYAKGKYVADGVFDPDAVDRQLGCAGLALAMRALDPSILSAPVPPPPKAPAVEARHAVPAAAAAVTVALATQASGIAQVAVVVALGIAGAVILYFALRRKG